jgi:DNA-binding transcriptional LysR family regulator
MALTQRELAAFLGIARGGSVGSAAAALSLTQPAVSRTLRKLETALGVPLFVRHATGMQLTPFGRALLPRAELLESEAMRAVEEIQLLKGASRGLARVGIVPSVAVEILPRALADVRARSPGLQITVIEGAGDQLAAALARGEIDFAVAGIGREPLDADIVATPLTEDEVCVVARAGHPVLERPALGFDDLARLAWALPERGNVIWTEFRLIFRREGVEAPPVALATNSVHALKSVILATDLVAMMARASFAVEERHGLLAPLRLPIGRWRRPLGVLRRTNGAMLPAAGLLLAAFVRAAADQPVGGDAAVPVSSPRGRIGAG